MTDYVAFSGGVDSTALALLMPDATPVFTDTAAEFPETYAHIAKFEAVTGREVVRIQRDGGLLEYIARSKFLPNHGARYCTAKFKIEPMNKWLTERLPATLNIALRSDEPASMRIGNLTTMDGLTIRYPMREWGMDRDGNLRVCVEHDLLPRYPAYMARGGCTNCFYKRKSEVRAMIALVPAVVDRLQALEESVQDERGTYFHMFPNVGMSIRDLRAQGSLFEPGEVYAEAADTSDVGQACGLFCHR
jgi:3'-phosphoadenosine 5'-phosphosulfate sulfotransferase (PAPS reductase)/FAD synthetase